MQSAKHPAKWLAPLAFLLLAPLANAQVAGEVEFSRGVGFAQTPGESPRTLGKGLPLREGDRLTTSNGASAVVKLQDGTRMTVRPNSEIVLQEYQFKENATDNSMLMQLVRGGFRAVTGLIAKGSPNAARIQTNTATIGIRGTDFDARLCSTDCSAESARIAQAPRPNAVQASARIVTAQGEVSAVDPRGERRRLVAGGSIYPGDTVETAAGTRATMAFRDETKISLGSNSRFRVDNFVYDRSNAREGRFLASILRGSVRALTGLIAKANTGNVGFSAGTSTIGIRGTGFDVEVLENGQSQFWVTLGAIIVQSGGNLEQFLSEGQGLFISPTGQIQLLTNQPPNDAQPPGEIVVDPSLFSADSDVEGKQGLFVFVRDGHIQIVSGGQILDLGRGEAGFSGEGQQGRPATIPTFLDFDTIQVPGENTSLLKDILTEQGLPKKTCN